MKSELLRKLIQLLVVMLLATFITFGLIYLSPSDPAEMLLTAHETAPSEELLEQTREKMGLNDPYLVQYGRWLLKVVKGDLGESYRYEKKVVDILKPRMKMTIRLAFSAFFLLTLFATSLGIFAAIRRGKLLDYVIRTFALIAISIPEFWLGMLLIYIFAIKLHWFKITDPYALKSVVLPAFTLAIPLIGRYIRLVRAAVLEELTASYVQGAVSRGLLRWVIILKHVLPNALKNIMTLLGLSLAALLGYTVIVETIFTWPGLGTMVIEAITFRDYPVIQGYVLIMTVIYVGVNFIVDILSNILDPRSQQDGGSDEKEI